MSAWGYPCFFATTRHLDIMDDLGSTECLGSSGWWLCLWPWRQRVLQWVLICFNLFVGLRGSSLRLGVSTNYLMHGFIWNYPSRFAALCQKAPLKTLGSHPVDVFASLEARCSQVSFEPVVEKCQVGKAA